MTEQAKRHVRVRRELYGLILCAVALLLAAIVYAPASWTAVIGTVVRSVLFGSLGTMAYFVPIGFVLSAFDFFLERQSSRTRARLAGWILLVILAAAVVQVFVESPAAIATRLGAGEGHSSFQLFSSLWRSGIQPLRQGIDTIWSGGALGSLIGLSLMRLLGKTGALIVLFLNVFAILLVLYNISIARLVRDSARTIGSAPLQVGRKIGQRLSDMDQRTLENTLLPEQRIGQSREVFNWIGEHEVPVIPDYAPYDDMYGTSAHEVDLIPEGSLVDEFAEQGRAHWEEKPAKKKRTPRKKTPMKRQTSLFANWLSPPISLLTQADSKERSQKTMQFVQSQARLLEEVLQTFKIEAKVVNYVTGPTITRYELQPAPGVKVSRIVNLSDDIALNLAALGVRIEAPIPGKPYIGIEIPNQETSPVRLRELIESPEFQKAKGPLVAALGRDAAGKVILCNLENMPHLLIAGATGSGKSVCINTMLISLLYRTEPAKLRMLLIDPKVVELKAYNGIPHLLQPVVTNPKKAFGVLNWAVMEMDRRYNLIAEKNVREINAYNMLAEHYTDEDFEYLPHILIVIDELADLMYTTATEVEDAIARLMAKARAAGIHLIIATQRPSVDVITGVIKSNIPSRIAFAVSAMVDSRTILDSGGAEKLLGKGDMLYAPLTASKMIRGQCALVTDQEVESVLSFIKSHSEENYIEEVGAAIELAAEGTDRMSKTTGEDGEDELLFEALTIFVEAGHATVSLLQRRLAVGHPRAARLVDRLEQLKLIGPSEGSKPRKVLISKSEYEAMLNQRGETS